MIKGSGWCIVMLFLVAGLVIGFSLAMTLVGDSPWSEFWLKVANAGD